MWFTLMWIAGFAAVVLGGAALIERRNRRGIVVPRDLYGRERRRALRAERARSTRGANSGGFFGYGYGYGGGDGGGFGDGGGGGCGDGGGGGGC